LPAENNNNRTIIVAIIIVVGVLVALCCAGCALVLCCLARPSSQPDTAFTGSVVSMTAPSKVAAFSDVYDVEVEVLKSGESPTGLGP